MNPKDPDAVDKHVGSRLRMRRLMLGMSQGKLADGLGVTFQQVQKYEKGTNRVGASRLQHIAQVLQVPPEFFFQNAPGQSKMDGQAPDPSYVSEFLATAEGISLARSFIRLSSPKLRRSIVTLVEQIADNHDHKGASPRQQSAR